MMKNELIQGLGALFVLYELLPVSAKLYHLKNYFDSLSTIVF